jgi:VWFA-related protein
MRFSGSTPILHLLLAASSVACAQTRAANLHAPISFRQALAYNAPAQADIFFTASLILTPKATTVAYKVDRRTLHYQPDAAGKLIAQLDCAAFQYDSAGKLLGRSAIHITSTIDPEYAGAEFAPTPISALQPIMLKPQAAALVLAIRDQSNGSLGNLQLDLDNGLSKPVASLEKTSDLRRRSPEAFAAEQLASRRITLDVNVPMPAGGVLPKLQAQDFTLLDNGRPQAVTSFAAVDYRAAPNPTEVILLFDAMNASFQNIILERQGIEQYLREDSGRLTNPVTIVYLTDAGVKISQPSRDGNALAREVDRLPGTLRLWDASKAEDGWLERLQRSLRALNQLATYEAAKPGRKLFLWIGPGWPLLSGPAFELSLLQRTRLFNSIVEVNTKLRDAHMTLSSIGTLNLAQGSNAFAFLYQNFLTPVAQPKDADAPNLGLQVLAHQTGGQVLLRDGDIPAQIARCVADSAFYYELTYTAPAATQFNELHTVQVSMPKEPELTPRTLQLFYLQP